MTNVHILQFWFWEKRRLDRLDRTIDYSKRDRPLVQYWDELKVRKVCAIFDKHGLQAGETVHDLKEPWDVPRSPTPELFDELPPTDSKLVMKLHDLVCRVRTDLMEQHLQTRVQMLRKFRHLEQENANLRNWLYANQNGNAPMQDYWSRPEYEYNDSDKFVASPLHGRDLASGFDGAQDDITSEQNFQGAQDDITTDKNLQGAQDDISSVQKEFERDDARKSDGTGGSTMTVQKKRQRKSTFANNEDFIYFDEPKQTKRGKKTPKDMSTPITGTDDALDEKIVEEVIDYVNTPPSSKVLVQIDEIHLYRADLRCLTAPTFQNSTDGWLQCKILDAAITWVRHMRPNPDVRADGNIFLERASVSSVLVRDGSVPSYTHALRNKTSTSSYGKKYLSHDMVSLPVNMMNKHCMSCGLFAVKNMEKFTCNNLDGAYTADDIPGFRKQLTALLVESPLNMKGRRNGED
ncbi:hypothetical protein VPH35_100261 [Triticum aestivum]